MKNKFLIVGSNGFIGSNLLSLLDNSASLNRSLEFKKLTPTLLESLSSSLAFFNSIESNAFKNLDAIIYCSGSASVARSYDLPYDDFIASVSNTTIILEYIRTIDPKSRPRLILLSSAAVYGNYPTTPLHESNSLKPISPYGENKVILENMARYYCEYFGLKVSIIRPFSIYGEGQKKQLLWDAAVKLTRGENHFFGTGNEMRDWLHVDDLSALLLLSATNEKQENFEIYNAGGMHLSVREILSRLSFHLGVNIEPEFTGEEHVGNPKYLISNSNKASSLLSWTPKIDIDEGLKRYAIWFKRVNSK